MSGFVTSLFMAVVAVAAFAFDGTRLIASHAQISDHAANAARIAAQEVVDVRLDRERIDPVAGSLAARHYLDRHGLSGHVQIDGLRVSVTVQQTVQMSLLSMIGVGNRTVTSTRKVELVDQ
ncbi:MAG: hypothetical protein RL072_1767 [Actinomycetota bacterium]|jgi:hypothetical protein